MAKIVSMDESGAQIKDGMTIMVSGFLSAGGPNEVLHAIAEAGVKDLTVICNDGGDPKRDHSLAELIHNGQVDGYLGSHLGTNREAQEMQNDGRLNVDLVPQGSLAEMIRAGGAGLGLAIAQSIVQAHGGSIGCTSAEGITRFTVTLPLLKNDSVKRGQEGC